MADGRCLDMSAVDILKVTRQGTERYGADADWGAYWRRLANTIEPPMCGGSAALYQITLTTCIYLLRLFNMMFSRIKCNFISLILCVLWS